MDKQDDTVTEAILDEIGRLGSVIESRLDAAGRFVAVAGSNAGIWLNLGLFQNQRAVLVGLPKAVAFIFAFMVQIYPDASIHSGIAKHSRASLSGGLVNPC